MNDSKSYLKAFFLILFLATTLPQHSMFWPAMTEASSRLELPEINLELTADMKVVFLGVPSEYIDETEFTQSISQTISQFAYPNNVMWNLNVSALFYDFPESVMVSLRDNAFHSDGLTYYNITLLDILLHQFEDLAVPKHGCLMAFMWVPDGAINHSWFYVQERPDLFLGRTDYFGGVPFKNWPFPSSFGGLRGALYFDVSEVMEETPTEPLVTNIVVKLFNGGLADMFPDLLGAEDSRMIAADMQRYEDYKVSILWFNGTGGQFYPEWIKEAFEDLMPWTGWTIAIETKPMDAALNDLIESRTVELSTPLTYSFFLSNGSSVTIEAWRNVNWELLEDSGEYDPLNRYLFEHVEDYFNLTDSEDKSIIPVVFLQLRNDTTFGGSAGIGPGVSWFLYNIVIVGFQGNSITAMGESGPTLLTHLLRHEIGHWVSLSHHSVYFESGCPKIIYSMRSITNRFCAFCKDARARMSFISYYKAIAELISNDQAKIELLRPELEDALQLFYDWKHVEAMDTMISLYPKAHTSTYEFQVNVDDATFNISVRTDSAISHLAFDKANKTVTFDVEGDSGTTGFFNLTVPTRLLGGPYRVTIDDTTVLEGYDAPTNETHAFIYCTYNHSSHTVEIKGTTVKPEFLAVIILLLFAIATLLAVIVYRRKKGT